MTELNVSYEVMFHLPDRHRSLVRANFLFQIPSEGSIPSYLHAPRVSEEEIDSSAEIRDIMNLYLLLRR